MLSASFRAVTAYGLARLMKALRAVDRDHAEEVAAEIYDAGQRGEPISVWLCERAEHHGIRAALDAERPRGTLE